MSEFQAPPAQRAPLVLLLVFLGGALGSLARELLAPALPSPVFWLPILVVNVVACFLVGWLFMLRTRLHPYWMHTLVGGFCGGFSTFSHFSYELVLLGDAGQWLQALAYVVAAVALGIGAAMLGEGVARWVHRVAAR